MFDGGGGVEGDGGGDAEVVDAPERAVQVDAGLGVHDEQATAGVDHRVEDPRGFVHHEVGLVGHGDERTGGGDDVGAEGEVRDEGAVHDVPLDAVDAGLLEFDAGLAQMGEVGGEHRGDDLDGSGGGRVGHVGLDGDDGRGRPTIPAYASAVIEPGDAPDGSVGRDPLGEVDEAAELDEVEERIEVVAERLVAGGEALARRADGRVVFVAGALPGERARVRLTGIRRGVERGEVERVLEASSERREAHCAHVADGCGGCDLPALSGEGQVSAKVEMVADALRRLGRIGDPLVRPGPPLVDAGFRTTLRLGVSRGRVGLRASASHDVVVIDHCVVAHPRLDELVAEGRFGGAAEVTLRVGSVTGERLALVSPTAEGVELPDDVVVVGADELAAGRRAWIHEEVAGRRWRVSAESFFQTRTDGAEVLVDVVHDAVDDLLAGAGGGPSTGAGARRRTLVDAYCGVGLFAGSLLDRVPSGAPPWRAVAVERSRSSVADARRNLSDLPARVVGASVERFRAPRADLVVADPSRAGLGRRGATVLASTRAPRIVLVSCDAASLGRDAALLAAEGYRLVESVVVDLFAHTSHVEVVSRFERAAG